MLVRTFSSFPVFNRKKSKQFIHFCNFVEPEKQNECFHYNINNIPGWFYSSATKNSCLVQYPSELV